MAPRVSSFNREASAMNYEGELARLYALQVSIKPDTYLHAHSRNRALIRRQISIFERCQPFLKDARTVLDWGCRHGADACLVRILRGDGVQIEGCDVDAGGYQAFYDFAQLRYTQLTHPFQLPYANDQFDAVIGGGVLEHVANDSESLKELYRILRPGGHFVMTMLPNKYSYTEWLNRQLKNPHHMRRYKLSEIHHMFMHHGFQPVVFGFHQMIPSLSNVRGGIFDLPFANSLAERLFWLNSILERMPPLNRLATNIFMVGKKVEYFL
jgi:SAM-dependent methyltransferase